MKKYFFYSLYYSNINTPPPFLYELRVDFSIHPEKIDIIYQKEFLDRAQFSEEELAEEGFSTNDDSRIETSLGGTWISYFKDFVEKSKWSPLVKNEELYNNNYITLSSQESEDQYRIQDGIEYELEELLQALVESLEIEAPLSIYMRKNTAGKIEETELYWSFKNRLFEIKSSNNPKRLSWEEGRELLSLFYGTDLSEQAIFKKSIPEGMTCINPGDGQWYKTPNHALWKSLIQKIFPA